MSRFKLKHPVWFSILYAIAELALLNVVGLVLMLMVWAFAHTDTSRISDSSTLNFAFSALTEGITAALVFASAWLLHFRGLLHRRGASPGRTLLSAVFPLILIGLLAADSIYSCWGKKPSSAGTIIWFTIYMVTIGILEETTFRGVILETLLHNFGTSRRGVWLTALLSSVLFGLAHLQNLLGADAISTLLQVFFAFCFGLLLACLYLRSGNLWLTILLHAGWDFSVLISVGIFGIGSMTQTSTPDLASIVQNLILSLICTIPVPFLMRKKKLDEITARFAPEILAERERVGQIEQKKQLAEQQRAAMLWQNAARQQAAFSAVPVYPQYGVPQYAAPQYPAPMPYVQAGGFAAPAAYPVQFAYPYAPQQGQNFRYPMQAGYAVPQPVYPAYTGYSIPAGYPTAVPVAYPASAGMWQYSPMNAGAAPAPQTAAPAPQNVVPAPQTASPAPQTAVPAPQTAAPAPQTAAPAPQNVVPAPQTAAPAPQNVAPAPQTAAPAPQTDWKL